MLQRSFERPQRACIRQWWQQRLSVLEPTDVRKQFIPDALYGATNNRLGTNFTDF